MPSSNDSSDARDNIASRPLPPQSDERRRMLRGALAVAPVVMTLASRPVIGQVTCMDPSMTATGSLNPSGKAAFSAQVCSGYTPEQWKTLAHQWPEPYCATSTDSLGAQQQATKYHCPTTGLNGWTFGDRTMLEVIDIGEGGGLGASSLGRYVVAALLNACSGRTPVLDETAVRNMWNDVVNQGYYEPTAGIRWTAPEIIAYLKTTMG
jgi:hypothetical protein